MYLLFNFISLGTIIKQNLLLLYLVFLTPKKKRERAKSIVAQKIDSDRSILSKTLSAGSKPVKIKVGPGDSIIDVLTKNIKSMLLVGVQNGSDNLLDISPIQFLFNGVLMTIHPLELYPGAVVIKDIIDDESMNNAIAGYIEKKYQEYSNNLGIDDLLSTSITQQYRVKKDQERKKYEAEKQRNIILEKEKTLKPMEFAPAKLINCSSLSAEILLKHHINLDTGRAIDDVYGMARVDGETLRKIGYDKNSSNAYG
ncbi:MAG TPA: hypothetical protein PLW93_03305, partial [Candidatus Absconditabacterales bacterium]|nr:hypothetical protein [Candidatus Absconditabacterales bacterium]